MRGCGARGGLTGAAGGQERGQQGQGQQRHGGAGLDWAGSAARSAGPGRTSPIYSSEKGSRDESLAGSTSGGISLPAPARPGPPRPGSGRCEGLRARPSPAEGTAPRWRRAELPPPRGSAH